MKTQPVELLEFVEDDLRYAWDYYDAWRSDGAEYFRQQFRDTVTWIEWNPELFPTKYRYFRRAIIKNTYFGAFYVIEPAVTTIVAVFDLRQKPSSVRRRILRRTKT